MLVLLETHGIDDAREAYGHLGDQILDLCQNRPGAVDVVSEGVDIAEARPRQCRQIGKTYSSRTTTPQGPELLGAVKISPLAAPGCWLQTNVLLSHMVVRDALIVQMGQASLNSCADLV